MSRLGEIGRPSIVLSPRCFLRTDDTHSRRGARRQRRYSLVAQLNDDTLYDFSRFRRRQPDRHPRGAVQYDVVVIGDSCRPPMKNSANFAADAAPVGSKVAVRGRPGPLLSPFIRSYLEDIDAVLPVLRLVAPGNLCWTGWYHHHPGSGPSDTPGTARPGVCPTAYQSVPYWAQDGDAQALVTLQGNRSSSWGAGEGRGSTSDQPILSPRKTALRTGFMVSCWSRGAWGSRYRPGVTDSFSRRTFEDELGSEGELSATTLVRQGGEYSGDGNWDLRHVRRPDGWARCPLNRFA